MMRSITNTLLTLVLMSLFATVQAATIKGLYSVELLVPEQLNQPATEQLKEGLQGVLIKVSGRSAVVNKPAVVLALRSPATLLQQFRYQSTQIPIAAGDGREVLGQRLILDFDPVLIDQLLTQAGMKAIGHARPSLMVWLADQRGGAARDFVAPESQIYSQLALLARQRGLPLEVPLLDLTDQGVMDVSDLWGFFRPQIEQASARYQPDAVLVGRLLQRSNGGWHTEWLLLKDGQSRTFEPSGALSLQLKSVLDDSADFVLSSLGASRFSYVESGLQLEVANVDDIADYLQLLEYLRQLPPVEKVRVSGVDADHIMFRVELEGGSQALEQATRLNPRMAPMSRITAQAEDAVLLYRWQE